MNAEQTVDNLATHHRQVAFSFLPFAEVWNDDALRREWDLLIDDTENLTAMYQSPEWLAFLHHSGQVDWGTVASRAMRREPAAWFRCAPPRHAGLRCRRPLPV